MSIFDESFESKLKFNVDIALYHKEYNCLQLSADELSYINKFVITNLDDIWVVILLSCCGRTH